MFVLLYALSSSLIRLVISYSVVAGYTISAYTFNERMIDIIKLFAKTEGKSK